MISSRGITRVSARHAGRRSFTRRTAASTSASTRFAAPQILRTTVGLRSYTSERVLQLRSGKTKAQQPKVLYDPTRETENCGVGLVASLKSIPSRRVVDDADEMLVRMSHRGGCGCDPASGDGAGKSILFEAILLKRKYSFYCILLSLLSLTQPFFHASMTRQVCCSVCQTHS